MSEIPRSLTSRTGSTHGVGGRDPPTHVTSTNPRRTTRRVTGGPAGVWASPTKTPAPITTTTSLSPTSPTPPRTRSPPRPTEASDLRPLRRRFVRVETRGEEMAASEGVLLGMGNPLLDISAVVDDAFLTK